MHRYVIFLLMTVTATIAALSQDKEVIIPKPIGPGSKIAIVTPASYIKDEIVDSAVIKLTEMGFVPVVYPNAKGKNYGSFPAEDELRAADLMSAFADPDIDAILCSRGGYGCVRILPLLDMEVIRANPKWLVGYSDISDLHAYMHKVGVASIHGPMAKHIAYEPDSLEATHYLFDALANRFPMMFRLESHPYNKTGKAKGRLVGGNLLTINGLAETEYDILNIGDDEDVILFIEDVGEKIYAIERVLMRLHLSGALSRVKGIIIGQFTEYSPSDDFETMEDMIHYWLQRWRYYNDADPMPIVFDFPTGHVTDNYPMIVSAEVTLEVKPDSTVFWYTGY